MSMRVLAQFQSKIDYKSIIVIPVQLSLYVVIHEVHVEDYLLAAYV